MTDILQKYRKRFLVYRLSITIYRQQLTKCSVVWRKFISTSQSKQRLIICYQNWNKFQFVKSEKGGYNWNLKNWFIWRHSVPHCRTGVICSLVKQEPSHVNSIFIFFGALQNVSIFILAIKSSCVTCCHTDTVTDR